MLVSGDELIGLTQKLRLNELGRLSNSSQEDTPVSFFSKIHGS
jgi:hypothetical protein